MASLAQDLLLRDYLPQPQLSVVETVVSQPRFPVIDAHNHLGEEFGGGWCNRPVEELLDVMNEAGVRLLVDLDGGWGEDILQQRLDKYKAAAPDRFSFFGGVEWSAWSDAGDRFGEWAAERFRLQVRRGAQGLKIWKNFGLSVRDQNKKLVAVDDIRLDPLWAAAGNLGVPITIHVADPVAFFLPLDAKNERWEELNNHPDWQFPSPPYPAFQTILDQLFNLVQSHPKTNFIGAHVGCYAENLSWVGAMLDRCPNFYVDIAARISELGRHPYSTRGFFIQYQDRILFGIDVPVRVDWYRLFYRFLETRDEYFNYDLANPPSQGRWQIYGLGLPDKVLKKIYYRNAAKLIHLKKD